MDHPKRNCGTRRQSEAAPCSNTASERFKALWNSENSDKTTPAKVYTDSLARACRCRLYSEDSECQIIQVLFWLVRLSFSFDALHVAREAQTQQFYLKFAGVFSTSPGKIVSSTLRSVAADFCCWVRYMGNFIFIIKLCWLPGIDRFCSKRCPEIPSNLKSSQN